MLDDFEITELDYELEEILQITCGRLLRYGSGEAYYHPPAVVLTKQNIRTLHDNKKLVLKEIDKMRESLFSIHSLTEKSKLTTKDGDLLDKYLRTLTIAIRKILADCCMLYSACPPSGMIHVNLYQFKEAIHKHNLYIRNDIYRMIRHVDEIERLIKKN